MNSRPPGLPASILLSGWYGVDNAGDEAILQQFIKEMAEPESTRIAVLTERPGRVNECYGSPAIRALRHCRVRAIDLLKNILNGELREHIRTLRSADLFVLGGGGILRDNTSLSNLVQILDEIWLKKLMAGKTALYAVGAGPFQTTVGKWLVRRTLAMCDLLTVRDEGSKAELAGIGVPPERIRVVADPALLLAPSPIQDPALRRWLISAAQTPRTLGLFLEEDYTPVREMARALDTLHSEHGFRFVGVPMRHHGAADDRQMARRVRDAMRYPDAVETVDAPLTAAELKWTAAQFALNITVRLHALIFSVSMGTPAIAVNYDAKVAYFLNSFGLDDWRVDVTKEAGNDIVVKTLEAYSDLNGSRQRISRRLEEQRQRASMAFVLLRQVLEGAGIARTAAQSEFVG